MKKTIYTNILVLFSFVILTGCIPTEDPEEIIKIRIDNASFDVPKKYLDNYQHEVPSFQISFRYPEDHGSNVSILVKKLIDFSDIENQVQNYKEVIPKPYLEDKKSTEEIWKSTLDNDSSILYVYYEHQYAEGMVAFGYMACGLKNMSKKKCHSYFQLFGVGFEISFDKLQLQNWEEIRGKSFRLLEGLGA